MDVSQEHALHARFLRGLATSPRRPAMRLGDGSISYEAAHEIALLWAGSLLASQTEPPAAIGVLAEKGLVGYVGILAALYTGAAAVPLHPAFPAARTRRMLEASGASALLCDGPGFAALSRTGLGLPVLAPDPQDPGAPAANVPAAIPIRPAAALAVPRPVRPGDVAYILFTSGSTGQAKGVPVTHASNQHYFQIMDRRYDFTEQDVFSQTVELNFDCAMFDLFCAWGAGACLQPVPMQAILDLPAFAAERGMTVWFSVPSMIALVRRVGGLIPGALPGLRWSLFAGEALRCSDAADWQAAASNSVLENLYGPTELTITITGHRWSPRKSVALSVNGTAPIGAVHEGHDYFLLIPGSTGGSAGDDRGTVAEGELCVTGPQLTGGYLDSADDAGRFMEHDGRRWYRTGDRVRRLPGGELAYLGRLDSQVQVQGLRVELAEIDQAIRACAGVSDAVTVARTTAAGTELVVFYTGDAARPAELARQLRQALPEGMVPRHFRHLDQFPLNANRKIDRARLADEATAGHD